MSNQYATTMLSITALIISIILNLITVILGFKIFFISRNHSSWICITFSFLLISAKRLFDLFFYLSNGTEAENYKVFYIIDIAVPLFIIIGLYNLRKILKRIKKSETDLNESENRFKTIFNNSSDEIFLADFDGDFIEVNREACEKLGYSREEMLKMNFRDIKTPKYINMVKPNIDIIRENGKHIYETEHFSKKDNKTIFLEMSSSIVSYKDKKAILTISRDITERRQIERKVLSAIIETEERERKRFAKEMHDGVGPILSTLKLYVNELSSDEITSEEKIKYGEYSNELIDDAISNIRTISNNLMPTLITNYGLVKAVDSFCKKINETGKIHINFIAENYQNRQEEGLELIFFRVIEELLNNTIKHANAKIVEILLKIENKKLMLTYYDNGIGLDIDDIFNNSKAGMGLKNIISRVKSINANYYFPKDKESGFKFFVETEL
ncbi:MAG: PAS domain S-box protein [Bacteroidetes bacterium]|nr:PAS domain S-box protein [Bacteroidota bacterium]